MCLSVCSVWGCSGSPSAGHTFSRLSFSFLVGLSPNKSAYDKWIQKFQSETKPRSPKDFVKSQSPTIFNKPKIRISSEKQPQSNSKIRKPTALTIDNEVYTAICSRKPNKTYLSNLSTIDHPPTTKRKQMVLQDNKILKQDTNLIFD